MAEGWGKCLLGQMQHDCRIFSNRIEHYRIVKLSNHFTDDVDALRFKGFQMGQSVAHGKEMECVVTLHMIDVLLGER